MVIGLIYLILLISQLGKHFWPGWSFVEGIKVDYLSPTLYITDLIWMGAFTGEILRYAFTFAKASADRQDDFGLRITKGKKDSKVMLFLRKHQKSLRKFLVITDSKVMLSLLFFFNVILASRWQVAVYGWFRLAQIWWWARYFSEHKKQVLKYLGWIIPWWICIETFLSLGQVVSGGSIGGIFYWLGERRFDYLSLGIARISWFGDQYVRAYGTFSHPNSLAGFLLVGLVMWNRNVYVRSLLYRWIINWVGMMGIILTGSRLVWGVGILILLLKIIKSFRNNQRKDGQHSNTVLRETPKKSEKIPSDYGQQSNAVLTITGKLCIGLGVFIMGASVLLANFDIVGGWSVDSLDLRWKLLKSGWNMWRQNWLFGVGLSNFLVNLPDFMKGYRWLQPVHNIFVLWLAETGLVGLIGIGMFLVKRVDFKKYGWVWLVIVLTGMFDHYWLTLPQNMGLLGLLIGLSLKSKERA